MSAALGSDLRSQQEQVTGHIDEVLILSALGLPVAGHPPDPRGCRDTRSRTRSLRHVALATASPEIDRHTIDVHRSVRDADRHGQAAPADQVRLSPAERSACGDRLHLSGRRRTGGSVLRSRSFTYAARAWWMVPAS
jgi:hypothetical protein